jgi:hypothetical protein
VVRSSDMSSLHDRSMDITAYEQAYVVPYGIDALTTTSTKFGVTVKDIIRTCASLRGFFFV